ncbi:MAG: hypothetical protein WCJ84_02535 [Candidatus Peregrinibacteria bacterium]
MRILEIFFGKELSPSSGMQTSGTEMLKRCEQEGIVLNFDREGKPFLTRAGHTIVTCTKVDIDYEKKEMSLHYPLTNEPGHGYGSLFYFLIAKYIQAHSSLTLVSRSYRFDKGTGLWRNLLSKKLASYDPVRNIFIFSTLPSEFLAIENIQTLSNLFHTTITNIDNTL